MSYCGLDLIGSLGNSKTCVQVILATEVSRTEIWVQEGQILGVAGTSLEELLAKLTEPDPVVMMNPGVLPPESRSCDISVLSLEMARQQAAAQRRAEETPRPAHASGATISHKIKPLPETPPDLKKARPIIFKPGDPPSIIIGRGYDCNLITDDHRASRKHCRVTVQKDNFFVQDLSSTNGTFLNGERINAVKARAGDVIMIGEERFILMSGSGF